MIQTDGEQGPWYQASSIPTEPNLFTTPDSQHHASLRKPIASVYTVSHLVQLEPFVDNCISLLKMRFFEFARSHEYLDIGRWMQLFSLDAIGEISVRLQSLQLSGDKWHADEIAVRKPLRQSRIRKGPPKHPLRPRRIPGLRRPRRRLPRTTLLSLQSQSHSLPLRR